ncbi:MAG TPA: beta-eliminating lyase-related protein [Granulicella sp.]|nr:beta-eliminating lyase-related protein [Granulicella sp.]
MKLNRRHFLLTGAPAAAAGLSLLQTSPMLLAQAPTRPAPAAPITDRTVALVGDAVPITPQGRTQQLAHLLEKSPNPTDVYLANGAVQQLEAAMAAAIGKEDAAFLPTGTLANNLGIRLLAGENRHVLVQEQSHLYRDESDSAQTLSGLNLVPLGYNKPAPTYDEIAAAIDSAENGRFAVKVGAISLESPVRRQDGASILFAELERIAALAKQKNIGMHWDGARSFLLTGTPNFDLRRTAALFDTVYVSLYKYLGAPYGAVLAGNKDLVARARELRHVYGGMIYQGWQAALPALDALPGFSDRFLQARLNFEHLLTGLQTAGGFTLTRVENGSNIDHVQIAPERLHGLEARLAAADIRAHIAPDGLMPLYINESILRRPPQELLHAFLG